MTAAKIKKTEGEQTETPESSSAPDTPQASSIIKVAPYPFLIELFAKEGVPPFKAQVVKMTDFGLLMKADSSHFYKVSESYSAVLHLPGLQNPTKVTAQVIKTYDAMTTTGGPQVNKHYVVELHFKHLTDTERSAINTYLVRSGQKKL